MPMVTVCPHYQNDNNIFNALLTLYPDIITEEELLSKIGGLLSRKVMDVQFFDRNVPSYKYYTVEAFFSFCQNETNHDTEECKFVLLLSAIGTAIKAWDRNFEVVRAYIYERVSERERPTLESLQTYVEETYKDKHLDLDHYKTMPHGKYYNQALIDCYSLFLPVFENSDKTRLSTLTAIDAFEMPKFATNKLGSKDFGSLMMYMSDRAIFQANINGDTVQSLNDLMASTYLTLLARYLEVDESKVELALNSYNYDPVKRSVFGPLASFSEWQHYPCSRNSSIVSNIQDVCSTKSDDEKCNFYCENIVSNAEMSEKVKYLNEMGLHHIGPLLPGHPHSLLPICRFQGEDANTEHCWHRIINDMGVCFSSHTGKRGSNRM